MLASKYKCREKFLLISRRTFKAGNHRPDEAAGSGQCQ